MIEKDLLVFNQKLYTSFFRRTVIYFTRFNHIKQNEFLSQLGITRT